MMILTIANHTFREAIRKKTLHILTGLGVLILAMLLVIPTTDEPDARVKMALVVFFQVVTLLCILGVIFLSATSLPHEIEDRTIYGILSKPISRLKIVAGKIAGFASLSALLLIILSLLNMAIIQRIASKLPEEYKGVLKARNEFNASQFSIKGKIHHTREEILWIEGGRSGIAVWSFSPVCKTSENASAFEVVLNLKIECGRGVNDTIPLAVGIENAISGRSKTEVSSATVDKPLTLKIAPEIIQDNGTINVTVFPLSGEDYLGVRPGDVKIFSLQKGFVSNYAKAIVITFLKFFLIITIAVMGSTYLSTPVSIVCALVIFLCGHILEYIRDFSLLMQRTDVHDHALPAVLKKPNTFLIYMDYLLKKPLDLLSFILPDFQKFDSLKFLLKGINIPLEIVGFSLGYTAMYAGICLVISAIIFKKREFY